MPGGEIQTDAIVRYALETGKQVFVPFLHKPATPVSNGPVQVMDMVRLRDVQDYEALVRDKWGIPSIDPDSVDQRDRILGDETTNTNVIFTLDLILLPGVAFDTDPETGSIRRLGHGRGFYDIFIQRYSSSQLIQKSLGSPLLLYGLALTQQYIDGHSEGPVPVAPHDKLLHGLILGDGTIVEGKSS